MKWLVICGLIIGLQLHAQTEFALLTDLHVSPGNANERALVKIIDEINAAKVPFVIITGDLTNQGSNEELALVKHLFDRFTMPYYVVPGNHETTWSQSAVKEYYRLFGNDRFCFKRGDLLFVGYNTGPYMKMGDGHVKQEDLRWLDTTLSKQATSGIKVYSFAHYPFTEGDLGNWREVVAVLKKYPTVVSFCGHGHQYQELAFGNLKGIMARSTFLGSDTIAGYTRVQLTPDSVFVNEKIVGEIPRRRFAFATDASDKMTMPQPPPVQQSLPKGVALTFYQDDASVFTGVAIGEKAIYYGNSLGEIKALSKKNGRMIWQNVTGFSLYSTPVCSDNRLIVPATDDNIYAFSAKNGAKLWKVMGDAPFVADGLVKDGKLYQGGYKRFYKIDLASGHIDWIFSNMDNYCQARPTVAEGKVFFGVWDTHFYCLDAQTGELVWKWSNGKNQNLFSPANCVPVINHNKVIIVAPDRYMTAFDPANGTMLWRTNEYQVRESQGSSQDGKTVYAKLMDGRLVAVSSDSADYRALWTVDLGLGYEHAPCPIVESRGIIYVGSRNGVVVAVDAKSHQVIWRYKCGNSEVNQFQVDTDGAIYFSLVEGKIYKLSVK